MKLQNIKNTIFPYGNVWFYVISILWLLAIAIFLISFPALLVSAGHWYEHETAIPVNIHNNLMELASTLYYIAFEMWRWFAVFLSVSAAVDMYTFYKIKQREEGYL